MNHKYITLGIAVIVAAVAVTVIGLAAPQQALAHYSHHHHHHYHHNNNGGIDVNQETNQANVCDNQALCLNNANNTADISR